MKIAFGKSWGIALALSSALVCSLSVRAEDATPPAETAKKPARPQPGAADRYQAMRAQRDAWIKEIGATDEQREKLRAAMKEQTDQVRAIRADTTLDAAAKREKIRSLQGGVTAKAKEILTPEQFAKYEKLRQERREQLNSRVERRRPPGDRKPTTDKPATEKAQTTDKAEK